MSKSDHSLRVGTIGGVPAALGGGGLERQIGSTVAALRARGLDVRELHEAPADWGFDVLHAFGHTADVGHLLHHWRRHPAHLVVSPVVVVPPRREWRLRLATRLPIPALEPRVLRRLTRRADRLIALTRWEEGLLRRVGGPAAAPVEVIGNGVDRAAAPLDRGALERRLSVALPERYAISVGAVSPRKSQARLAATLAGAVPLVVVGGWEGGGEDRRQGFARMVEATGGVWLGELREREEIDGLIAAADALVHLSGAEGQSLAVLEALALGTRCLLSDLPQQRELAARWPGLVEIVVGDAELLEALRHPPPPRREPAAVPSWDEVAARLEAVYAGLSGRPRLWGERA